MRRGWDEMWNEKLLHLGRHAQRGGEMRCTKGQMRFMKFTTSEMKKQYIRSEWDERNIL